MHRILYKTWEKVRCSPCFFLETHIYVSQYWEYTFLLQLSRCPSWNALQLHSVQNVRKSYVQPMLLFRNTVLRVHFFITAISLSKDLRLTYVVVTSQQLLLEIRTQHLATQVFIVESTLLLQLSLSPRIIYDVSCFYTKTDQCGVVTSQLTGQTSQPHGHIGQSRHKNLMDREHKGTTWTLDRADIKVK